MESPLSSPTSSPPSVKSAKAASERLSTRMDMSMRVLVHPSPSRATPVVVVPEVPRKPSAAMKASRPSMCLDTARDQVVSTILGVIRTNYFIKKKELRRPVAPVGRVLCGFGFEVVACTGAFALMVWFFATTLTLQTTIVDKPQQGATCATLTPKRGVVYYSDADSENAQYAGLAMNYSSCVDYLTKRDVCADGNRLDRLVLWGLSNPNNSQYYPPTSAGSKGYFSFTPTQTAGLSTQLKAFFQPSISFPKPDIAKSFTGTSTNWYVYNLAKNTASDAFTPFPAVAASTFLYDPKAQKVYDPDPTTQQQDYDLSGAAIGASALEVIGTMGKVTGHYFVSDLGVYDGVYHGLRGGAAFSYPRGVAVDAAGNIYVADTFNNLVRRFDATTQAVTNLGTSASPAFNSPRGLAVDADGNVYVADEGNNLVRRIDATTQAVTNLGISASPAFNGSLGVAVDAAGNVYVADTKNNLVRKIDPTTQAMTSFGIVGTSAPFKGPSGVAVCAKDSSVYVADEGNNLMRRIDATTQAVTNLASSSSAFYGSRVVAVDADCNVFLTDYRSQVYRIDATTEDVTILGTSASPEFNSPGDVAVDFYGNVFVADTYNNLVRRIDAKTQAVTRLVGSARVFSWDMRNSDPKSFTLWPDTALKSHTSNSDITLVDSAAGGCQKVVGASNGLCFLLAHAEYNAETGRMYLEFQQFNEKNAYDSYTFVNILDPATAHTPIPSLRFFLSIQTRLILGVFKTAVNGTILFSTMGAYSDKGDQFSYAVGLPGFSGYNALVSFGTSILDASKVPAVAGSQPRYLMLLLQQKGTYIMFTYDTFRDAVVASNTAATAATQYMLAFTWGVCSGSVTRSLVELSFSNDYTNVCKLPDTGLYYQSPNRYYAIPYACLGIAYDKLLTDCPEIRANMKALVDASCQASIPKVCRQQYDLNPPFSCVSFLPPSPLSVLSLAFSNTLALSTFLAAVVAAALGRIHNNYQASAAELALANPDDGDENRDQGGAEKEAGASAKDQGDVEMPPSAASAFASRAELTAQISQLLGTIQANQAANAAAQAELRAQIASLQASPSRRSSTRDAAKVRPAEALVRS